MSLSLGMLLIVVALLFATGIYCLLVTRNMMRILLGLEILTKGVTLLLAGVGYLSGNMATVQAFIITVIIIEVVVFVVAAGIMLGAFRHNNTLDTRKLNNLKG